MKFSKLHGCGNDYLVLDAIRDDIPVPHRKLIQAMCHRRTGVGADGVIRLESVEGSDGDLHIVAMRIWNADGSEAEMCGNGLRLVARYLHDADALPDPEQFAVRIGNRMTPIEITREGDEFRSATVRLGCPEFRGTGPMHLTVGSDPVDVFCVSIGNPHAVLFPDDVHNALVAQYGPAIEQHPTFDNGTNVEFVSVVDRSTLRVRVWERGSGETLACGSGACAAVAICQQRGLVRARVDVHMPGGVLTVKQDSNGELLLGGPAEPICDGVWTGVAIDT